MLDGKSDNDISQIKTKRLTYYALNAYKKTIFAVDFESFFAYNNKVKRLCACGGLIQNMANKKIGGLK